MDYFSYKIYIDFENIEHELENEKLWRYLVG